MGFKTFFILIVMLGSMFNQAHALEDVNAFPNALLQKRYQSLNEHLRCPKCQNQNLADSNSMIAEDLRKEVKNLLLEGKTDRQIEDYLVARYGEFVLYKPRLNQSTRILWFAPFLLLIVGVMVVVGIVIRQRRVKPDPGDSVDTERLKQLLKQTDGKAQ